MELIANGWTTTIERLRPRWRAVRPLAPYVIALALPGSFLWLPLLAWWQHRRRDRVSALNDRSARTPRSASSTPA